MSDERVSVDTRSWRGVVETDPHMALWHSETAGDDDGPYYHTPSYGDKGCINPTTNKPGVIVDVDPEVGHLVCDNCGDHF